MLDERTVQDVGAALLRIALGVVFLAHSALLKLAIYGMPGTAQFFESLGLPGVLAYIVVCTEILGGSMLILGVQARWVALALTPILIGATWTHWPNGWLFTAANGGWEYPAYLTVMAVACFLIGEGRFVLVRSHPLPVLDAGAAR
ncbi:MAG: DoxX family protein [Alphaproteobacteria bacterium]|nr:DoxX family protein [Alphaproteobacteria bacterium]MBO6862082.1 DoxX family protein [Alphaproteobacteria bacterium]